jgi:hypothetical protein
MVFPIKKLTILFLISTIYLSSESNQKHFLSSYLKMKDEESMKYIEKKIIIKGRNLYEIS